MGRYLTGRSRTLTVSATFVGRIEAKNSEGDVGLVGPDGGGTPSTVDAPYLNAGMEFTFEGCNVSVARYLVRRDVGTESFTDFGASVTLSSSQGLVSGTSFSSYPHNDGSIMTHDFGGTVDFSVNVEEYLEDLESGFYANIPDAPSLTTCRIWERILSSSSSCDVAGVALSVSYTENGTPIIRDVGEYRPSADVAGWAGGGASGSWSISPTGSSWSTSPTGGFDSPSFSVTGTAPAAGTGSVEGWCSLTLSSSNPPSGAIVQGSVGTTVAYEKDVGIGISVYAMENPYPSALTVALTGIYDGGGTAISSASISGGSGSASGVQKIEQASGSVSAAGDPNGLVFTSPTISNFGPVGADITGASLTAAGEDPGLTRLLARGPTAGGISLALAETYPTPTGTTWPAAAASITNTFSPEWPSGSYPFLRLSLVGSGGAAMAGTITIPPCSIVVENGSTTGYPQEIDIYPDSGAAETPTKTWTFTTGDDGSTVTVEIPLYAPDNITASPDIQDTDWPYPVRRPMYAGVWRIPSITVALTAPGAGQTVHVLSAELFRSTHTAKITCLPTFYNSIYSDIGGEENLINDWPLQGSPQTQVGETGTSNHYVRRFLLAIQDGIQSLECSDFGYAHVITDSALVEYLFGTATIDDMVNGINGQSRQLGSGGSLVGLIDTHPGWAAANDTPILSAFTPAAFPGDLPPIAYYLDASLDSTFLAGGGLLRTGTTLSPQFDLTGGPDSAQPLYDLVDWHPGWLGFDSEGPTIAVGAILRAEAHGQILTAASSTNLDILAGHKQPGAGTPVSLVQTDASPTGMNVGAAAGSATSDDDGFYHTSAPAGRAGGIGHNLGLTGKTSADSNYPIPGVSWFARHRHRAAFIRVVGGSGPIAIDSPRSWLHVARGKAVVTFHLGQIVAAPTGSPPAPAFASGDHAVDRWIGLTHDPRRAGTLFLLGLGSGDGSTDADFAMADPPAMPFTVYASTDGGMTITGGLTTVDAKSARIERDSERGAIVLMYADGGNNTMRKVSIDGGATWGAAAAATDSTGTAMTGSPIDLAQDHRAIGVLVMTLKTGDTSAAIYTSTDIGATWTQKIALS